MIVEINGTHKEAYAQLPKYIKKLKQANPGSDITLETMIENKFQLILCILQQVQKALCIAGCSWDWMALI